MQPRLCARRRAGGARQTAKNQKKTCGSGRVRRGGDAPSKKLAIAPTAPRRASFGPGAACDISPRATMKRRTCRRSVRSFGAKKSPAVERRRSRGTVPSARPGTSSRPRRHRYQRLWTVEPRRASRTLARQAAAHLAPLGDELTTFDRSRSPPPIAPGRGKIGGSCEAG